MVTFVSLSEVSNLEKESDRSTQSYDKTLTCS